MMNYPSEQGNAMERLLQCRQRMKRLKLAMPFETNSSVLNA